MSNYRRHLKGYYDCLMSKYSIFNEEAECLDRLLIRLAKTINVSRKRKSFLGLVSDAPTKGVTEEIANLIVKLRSEEIKEDYPTLLKRIDGFLKQICDLNDEAIENQRSKISKDKPLYTQRELDEIDATFRLINDYIMAHYNKSLITQDPWRLLVDNNLLSPKQKDFDNQFKPTWGEWSASFFFWALPRTNYIMRAKLKAEFARKVQVVNSRLKYFKRTVHPDLWFPSFKTDPHKAFSLKVEEKTKEEAKPSPLQALWSEIERNIKESNLFEDLANSTTTENVTNFFSSRGHGLFETKDFRQAGNIGIIYAIANKLLEPNYYQTKDLGDGLVKRLYKHLDDNQCTNSLSTKTDEKSIRKILLCSGFFALGMHEAYPAEGLKSNDHLLISSHNAFRTQCLNMIWENARALSTSTPKATPNTMAAIARLANEAATAVKLQTMILNKDKNELTKTKTTEKKSSSYSLIALANRDEDFWEAASAWAEREMPQLQYRKMFM